MAGHEPTPDDDETLILRILDRDQDGLARLVELYGPKVKGYLRKHYGDTLSDLDIDAVFFSAIDRVWRYAGSFNPATGSFRSWFLRIAQREAINMVSDHDRHAGVDFDLEAYAASDDCDPEEPIDKKTKQRVDDLQWVIEHKLEGLQQAIIQADLQSHEVAGAGRLAKIHGTNKNSIYVSRNKARANIRKHMTEIENRRSSPGGRQ